MRHTLKGERVTPSLENRETKISCDILYTPRKIGLHLESHLRGEQDHVWQNQEVNSSSSTSPLFSKWTPGTLSCLTQHSVTMGSPTPTCFRYFRSKYFLISDSSPRTFLWSTLSGHTLQWLRTNLVKTFLLIDLDYDIHCRGPLCVSNGNFWKYNLTWEVWF